MLIQQNSTKDHTTFIIIHLPSLFHKLPIVYLIHDGLETRCSHSCGASRGLDILMRKKKHLTEHVGKLEGQFTPPAKGKDFGGNSHPFSSSQARLPPIEVNLPGSNATGKSHYSFGSAWSLCLWPFAAAPHTNQASDARKN